jgi:hypothetical protein
MGADIDLTWMRSRHSARSPDAWTDPSAAFCSSAAPLFVQLTRRPVLRGSSSGLFPSGFLVAVVCSPTELASASTPAILVAQSMLVAKMTSRPSAGGSASNVDDHPARPLRIVELKKSRILLKRAESQLKMKDFHDLLLHWSKPTLVATCTIANRERPPLLRHESSTAVLTSEVWAMRKLMTGSRRGRVPEWPPLSSDPSSPTTVSTIAFAPSDPNLPEFASTSAMCVSDTQWGGGRGAHVGNV